MPDSNLGKLKAGIDFWLVRFENLCFTKKVWLENCSKHTKKNFPLLLCTWFLKNRVWKIKFCLPISNLIFAGYTGSNNQVKNRLKIQFVKLNFSNSIFQKSSTDQKGVNKGGKERYIICFVCRSKFEHFLLQNWRILI